jgi:hypothetical protein
MTPSNKPDLALSQISRFTRHDVKWSRGAFMIIDRRTANPIAWLRPIPDSWSYRYDADCARMGESS